MKIDGVKKVKKISSTQYEDCTYIIKILSVGFSSQNPSTINK
jgi:hypothetical protein